MAWDNTLREWLIQDAYPGFERSAETGVFSNQVKFSDAVYMSDSLDIVGDLTITGDLTVSGDFTFGDSATDSLQVNGVLTVGEDDTGYDVIFYGATTGKKMTWDESENMLDVDGIMKVHNRPVSIDTYALEVKCDYDQASGTGQGALQVSTRVYPDSDTTTMNAQGGYVQCQLHADDTMTGGAMTGFLAQAHNNGGTLNGSAITVTALRAQLADGGTWTEVDRVSVLHVQSDLDQAVSSGTYNLLYIQNTGTTTAADAIAVEGNDKISAIMTLTNIDGAAAVENGSVLADISGTPNDGYIKVVVEGEDKYIPLYDLKAS
jgi:hypothetical protein